MPGSNGVLAANIRNQLLQDWSIYNYQPRPNENNADHFFVTFDKFGWVKARRLPVLMLQR